MNFQQHNHYLKTYNSCSYFGIYIIPLTVITVIEVRYSDLSKNGHLIVLTCISFSIAQPFLFTRSGDIQGRSYLFDTTIVKCFYEDKWKADFYLHLKYFEGKQAQ